MTQPLPASPSASSPRSRRSASAALLALALAAGGLAQAGPASATVDPQPFRIAGDDRYDTSAATSFNTYDDGEATHVVVASGVNFPDGLSAASYAGAVGGPVLTVPPSGPVPQATFDEMDRLGATDVTIVGGTAAVSDQVAGELTEHGLTVDRISGADRYATSAAVSERSRAEVGDFGLFAGLRTAFLATGQSFADALAASAPSYSHVMPVLLTPSDQLSAAASKAITDGGVQQVIIMGGEGAVSPAAAASVQALTSGAGHVQVIRISGADRYETAAHLADTLLGSSEFDYDYTYVTVASGADFADALSAGPYSGYYHQALLFAEGAATDEWLVVHNETIDNVEVVGGTARISDARLDELIADATTADTTAPSLVASSPASGDDAAPVEGTVTGTFSEPVAAGSSVTVTHAGVPVAGTVTISDDGTQVIFTHAAPLAFGTDYVASFTVEDAAGNQSTSDVSFTTFVD